MRERARDLDPNLPVTLSSMDLLLSEAQWQPRFLAQLALGFATGALMVSGIGVYGAAAARAVRRRREFAVRLAVGARPGAIVRLVLSRGLKVAATGIAIGLPGTWAASRIVSSLLFETSPNDAAALGAAVSVLVMLVVAGSLVPAIGASRIDPISVLKSE
jgi:ABC-type antimicrobial peptide transport system permease subunit